ncbi:MAG TPA: 6-phosphofructokinase, partial [Gammaproteobacteria bacterium]|nr:6-phosphofructokinase [Gammaproteobacteria bacterium]
MKEQGNLFYAQSGGVTPVINATAAGVIDKAAENKAAIPKVFMGHNGILGLIHENLINGFSLT